jgi:hypothetical protein
MHLLRVDGMLFVQMSRICFFAAVSVHYAIGLMQYSRLVDVMQGLFGLTISEGAIANMLAYLRRMWRER